MGYKQYDDTVKVMILSIYNDTKSLNATQKEYNKRTKQTISRATIKKWLDEAEKGLIDRDAINLMTSVDNVKKEKHKHIMDILNHDNRIGQIMDKTLEVLNSKKNIEKEIDKYGIKTFITQFGVLADKQIKLKELEIKQKELEKDNNTIKVEIINDLEV